MPSQGALRAPFEQVLVLVNHFAGGDFNSSLPTDAARDSCPNRRRHDGVGFAFIDGEIDTLGIRASTRRAIFYF